jgi:hypothetical protein
MVDRNVVGRRPFLVTREWERTLAVVCAIAVAGGAAGGCGGTSKQSGEIPLDGKVPTRAEQTNALGQREFPGVRRLLAQLTGGINARNPAVCGRVYTRRYVETLTHRRGAAALAQCRSQIAAVRYTASVKRIERLELRRSGAGAIDGQVQVLEGIGNGLLRARLDVVRTPAGYRIAGGQGRQVRR